jgi:hypothetical protein
MILLQFLMTILVEGRGWPRQALLAQRGKSNICFLSKILPAVWMYVSFIPTMMAGLKLGPFIKLEKPLISLVIDISSIGLCFIFWIGCSLKADLLWLSIPT